MSDSFALKKLKDEARDTLRKAIVLYLDLLEEMGTSLGGPTEDFYADNCTVPVCDFWHGSERFEISVGPLELVEGCRSPEESGHRCVEGREIRQHRGLGSICDGAKNPGSRERNGREVTDGDVERG